MSLSRWLHAREDDVASASDELDTFPVVRENGRVQVPFEYTDRDGYQGGIDDPDIRQAVLNAPDREVALDGLRAIQRSVWRHHVRRYFDEDAKPEKGHKTSEKPVVIQRGGVRYIYDGHHRLTAKKLLGKRSAIVKYVDLDALKSSGS